MKKKIAAAVFVLAVLISLYVANGLLKIKSIDGVKQAEYMYYQPKNTVDVAFLGSSHVHCDVNTVELWDKYGIAAYDYSAAEQPLWVTYYYFKELMKYQKPKLVVIDLFTPARIRENYRYRWIRDNLYGVRLSPNKIRMLLTAVEHDKLSIYFPSFGGYHSRWKELGRADLKYLIESPQKRAAFKGFTPYMGTEPQKRPTITEKHLGGLSAKSEEYLRKIIKYAADNDVELMFVVAPYTITDSDQLTYNQIEKILSEEGKELINTNFMYDEMGLDFETDFNDFSHLNLQGTVKYTDFLAKYIKSEFDIPDRRQDERYSSWDKQKDYLFE